MQWGDKLMAAGAFFTLFSVYLFNKGPSVNSQQYAFRVGLAVLGILLTIAGMILRAKNRQRD